jgi:hypothetical protein
MTKLKSDLPPHVVKALLDYYQVIASGYNELLCITAENGKPDAQLYQTAFDDAVLKFNELLINIRVLDYPSDVTASACSATGDLLREPEDENSPF